MSDCVIKVDSRLRLFLDSLTPEVAEEIRSAFTHVNPAYLMKKRLGIPAWSEPPTYRTHTTEEGVLSLPRGGMARVRTILQANGYTWTIQDTRVTGKVVKAGLIPPTKMVLRDYQEEMMAAAFKKENCLLRAGTGSGKSTVAIAFASKVGLYTLVIVWSAALFEQWMDRIESELGVPRSEIGIIKGSITKIRPITMAMQQTIASRDPESLPLDTFGAVICDECFSADSTVLLADGTLKRIADVCVGDRTMLGGIVTALMSKTYSGDMYCWGTESSVTEEHPVATSEGWKPISEVCIYDTLYQDTFHEHRLQDMWCSVHKIQSEGYMSEARVRLIRCRDRAVSEVPQDCRQAFARPPCIHTLWTDKVLECGTYGGYRPACGLQDARSFTARTIGQNPSTIYGSGVSSEAFEGGIGRSAHSLSGPGATSSEQSESGCNGGSRCAHTLRGCAPWERWGAHTYGACDGAGSSPSRVRSAMGCAHWAETPKSVSLQDRLGSPSGDDRSRAGWFESSNNNKKSKRQTKDISPRVERVVSDSLHGGSGLEPCHRRVQNTGYQKDVLVYNLETEGHVYVCGGILVHNCQRFAAKTVFQAVDIWPAKYRIGISADESRKDKREFLIYDLFGAVASDIKRNSLEDEGSILEVEVRIVPTDFKADWYKEDHDFNRLLHEMMDSNDRDTLIIQHAQEEIDKGEQLFVLSHRREHCHTLAKRLSEKAKTGLLLGGPSDVEAFGQTKRGLEAGTIRAGVGTIQAIAQGLDIPRIGRIVVCTPMASNKQLFGQARGRVCRTAIKEGKKDARLYYMWDQHVYGLKHVENLLAWNRKVLIKEKGEWVNAREWLKSAKNPRDIEGTNFEFLESLDNAE
jgi:superfamily II DNA or RNA helicase